MKRWLPRYSGFNLPQTRAYSSSSFHEHDQLFPAFAVVCQLQEKAFEDLCASNAITYQHQNLTIKFSQLSCEVVSDYYYKSSPDSIQKHPSYLKIIAMGKEAIPFLIEELDKNPTYWFRALGLVANSNPIKQENRGIVPAMINDWKLWALEHGYIQ